MSIGFLKFFRIYPIHFTCAYSEQKTDASGAAAVACGGMFPAAVAVPLWPAPIAPPAGDTAPAQAAEGVRRILPKKKKSQDISEIS